MGAVTQKYLDSLPTIYRDILALFPEVEPARRAGWGLAYQTLFERLREPSCGEHVRGCVEADRKGVLSYQDIVDACRNMEEGGAVKIEQGMFVCPTEVGEELIALLTGKRAPSFRFRPSRRCLDTVKQLFQTPPATRIISPGERIGKPTGPRANERARGCR